MAATGRIVREFTLRLSLNENDWTDLSCDVYTAGEEYAGGEVTRQRMACGQDAVDIGPDQSNFKLTLHRDYMSSATYRTIQANHGMGGVVRFWPDPAENTYCEEYDVVIVRNSQPVTIGEWDSVEYTWPVITRRITTDPATPPPANP